MTPPRPLVADVDGEGPAVLLLHGQPGGAGDWSKVVARLRARYTTVVPDRLGYGRTGGPAGDFAANAEAALALLDRLDLCDAIVAGHSWGGAVALEIARRSGARTAGLVLVASVAPGDPPGRLDRLLARRPVGELAALATLGVAGRALALAPLRRALARTLPDGAAEMVAQARPDRGAWRAFAPEQRAYVEGIGSLAGGLGGLDVPTRVVAGGADHVVGPGAGRLLAGAIPGAVLDELPGAGHLIPWEHPAAVVAAVDAVAARRS